MIAVGMGLIWAGYGLTVYGYILVRGYDITFSEVFSPTSYLKKPYSKWPKIASGYTGILPNGASGSAQATSTTSPGPAGPPNTIA